MIRVLADELPEPGGEWTPSDEEAHHLVRVRRVKPGQAVEVIDGQGGAVRGVIAQVSKRSASIQIKERIDEQRESSLDLTIVAAIPVQANTFDAALPGLVQLGVIRIILTPTAYGGKLKKDLTRYSQRLQDIAANALKQSGRLVMPGFTFYQSWEETCRRLAQQAGLKLLFHPNSEEVQVTDKVTAVTLCIGPEGGFSDEEVALAQTHSIQTQGLGPRILKMETALIGATFWAQQRFGDLNLTI